MNFLFLFFLPLSVGRNEATIETSTFSLRQEKDDQKIVLEDKDLEVIGTPIIKYGDSTVIMQHATTCLWVSYKVCFSLNLYFSISSPWRIENQNLLPDFIIP